MKCLCVIEIESNPGHYNNGIIDLLKEPIILNVSDMGWEALEKSCDSVLKGARFLGDK